MSEKKGFFARLRQGMSKSREQIDADTDRNNYMDALTAKEYGLVDNVIGKRE